MLLVAATGLAVAACEPVGVIGIDDAAVLPLMDASVDATAASDAADVGVDEPVDDGGVYDGRPPDDASPLCTGRDPPVCLVGTLRWCSNQYGEFGTQRCGADAGRIATWGTCTTAIIPPPQCSPKSYYDENCCVQSGGCCAHAVNGVDYGSVGACGAIDPCNSCHQLCVTGAVRWCDYFGDAIDAGGNYAWGKQVCNDDGTWGTCVAVQVNPPGCDPTYFDGDCCAEGGACCQVYDSFGESASYLCPPTSCDAMWAGAADPVAKP
jgi:hypothetical protein